MKNSRILALLLALALACTACMSLAVAEKEVPTLKVLTVVNPNQLDLTQWDWVKQLEKEAGVRIDWEIVTSQAWAEQKTMVLAGGELPDIFFSGSALSMSDIITNIDLFLPLNDLVAEYGSNVQKMWEEWPITKNANMTADGNVYAIGHVIQERATTECALYINQVWLDNLDLEAPTTVDELVEVLKAFRDLDANGNGDPNDEIPYQSMNLGDVKRSPSSMRGYFHADNSMNSERTVDADGKVQYMPVSENYKAWIEWVHMLYEEKLVNSDMFTIDRTSHNARITNVEIPLVGVWGSWYSADSGQWESQYVPLDIAEGPFGKAYIVGNEEYMYCGQGGYACAMITTECENPEAAMRWLNLFYAPEYSIQMALGQLGVAWELNADGNYEFIATPEVMKSYGLGPYEYGYLAMHDYGPRYVSREMQAKIIASPPNVGKKIIDDLYIEDNLRDPSYIYPMLNLPTEENDEVVLIETDMKNLTSKMSAQWVVEGIGEGEWEKYVSDMYKMGLDRYLEIYQEAYDNLK